PSVQAQRRPACQRQEPRGGAPAILVEERRLPPDASKDVLLAVLSVRAGDGTADSGDGAPVPSPKPLERFLAPVRDRTQELSVTRPRRRGPIRRCSFWLRWHCWRVTTNRLHVHLALRRVRLPARLDDQPQTAVHIGVLTHDLADLVGRVVVERMPV